jgi:SAM-dependent methyltransferase
MKDFWNSRYSGSDYAYGEESNEYLRQKLTGLKPGRILFPAEGEGRNAVHAATLGWEVTAFDISAEGKKKADALAAKQGVSIDYHIGSIGEAAFTVASFDALVLVFAHFHDTLRKSYHRKLLTFLRPGGYIILEAFSKRHIAFNSVNEQVGGPKDISMLYDTQELADDFTECSQMELYEAETELREGIYHVGRASVVRYFGVKHS